MFRRLSRTTFLLIATAIIAGILAGKFLETEVRILCPIAIIVAILAVIILIIYVREKVLMLRNVVGVMGLMVIMISSWILNGMSGTELIEKVGNCEMSGMVRKVTKRDSTGTKFWFEADTMRFKDCEYYNRRGVVKLKNVEQRVGAGDYLRFKVKVWKPSEFNGFDYPKWLKENRLEYAVYPYECEIDTSKSERKFFFELREMMIEKLAESGVMAENLALLQAMFLGERSEIDNETRLMFNYCGIGHILAVSGMHVGIIWAIFLFIFTPLMNRRRWLDVVLNILIIGILWFYANITGMAVPIERATIMTTAFIITGMLGYKTNNYNTLFLALCIVLLIEPEGLFSIGLQLSFTAVLGLMAFSRWFNFQDRKRNVVVNYIIGMIEAAIIAQIVLLPLVLYYFHYFPTYFLINNVVILIILPVILLVAIMVVVIPVPCEILGKMIDEMMNFMNWFLEMAMSWKYSVVEISIDGVQCIMLLVLITLVAFFVNREKFLWRNA